MFWQANFVHISKIYEPSSINKKDIRDHVSLPCTPETWPLYHIFRICRWCLDVYAAGVCVEWRVFFRQRELARRANEQPKDIVNFFLLPPWSVDARKFSTHATISADSWPISQLRMDWYIRRGSGRSPKKQVRAAESSNTSTVVGWTGKTATHVVTFSRLSIVVALTVLYHSCTTRSVLVSD